MSYTTSSLNFVLSSIYFEFNEIHSQIRRLKISYNSHSNFNLVEYWCRVINGCAGGVVRENQVVGWGASWLFTHLLVLAKSAKPTCEGESQQRSQNHTKSEQTHQASEHVLSLILALNFECNIKKKTNQN